MDIKHVLFWHYFFVDDYKRMKWIMEKATETPEILKHPDELIRLLQLTPKQRERLNHYLQLYTPQKIIKELQEASIYPITLYHDAFPSLLKEIYDPPFVLYCMGNTSLLHAEKKIGVVGTRIPTSYGVEVTRKIITELKDSEIITVSGLAKGIDSVVHRTSLDNDVPTIGVLGSGFEHIYPKDSISIINEMKKENLILTEYPPIYPPRNWYFPKRNRIISGLSKGVLVVEAKIRSGSLITADQALEQGRDVFACPGSVFSKESEGTNWLLSQGAKVVTKGIDLLEEM